MQRYLIAIPRPGAAPADLQMASEGLIADRVASTFFGAIQIVRTPETHFRDVGSGRFVVGRLDGEAKARTHGDDRDLAHWWGEIVTISIRSDGVSVYRDPSGRLGCFRVEQANQIILCSDWKFARALVGLTPDISWESVIKALALPQFLSRQTGLRGVCEILPGELVELTPESCTTTLLWSPADLTPERQRRRSTTPGAAASALRRTIVQTIGAQAKNYQRPILELSGGVDSSVLAASLAAVRSDFVCVNFVTASADGDEREPARRVARQFGVELIERVRDPARIELERSAAADQARPSARAFAQESDRISLEVAQLVGGDCLISGGGGDNVFFSSPAATPLQDRLRAGLFGRQTFRTMLDVADVADRTAWWAVKRALAGRRRTFRPSLDFLSSKAIGMVREQEHPWLDAAEATSPDLQVHVESIVQIFGPITGLSRAQHLPLLFPLMARPVLEECLSMPGWLWVVDGYDRSLARQAFADVLPADVIFRRSKGGLDHFSYELYRLNRETIRHMLLDGLLASNQLIDEVAINSELARTSRIKDYRFYRLLELVDIEAWARAVFA
ncbi:asparagine synthase C-terminal domain-containing protein [Sphingomonas sp. 1185]|uniref:asparagine synthase C-terminal domain-containing protein n=1 Tax=Sphingomonas sp. 1185 TaxID=3156411 RepID=UPI003393CCD1